MANRSASTDPDLGVNEYEGAVLSVIARARGITRSGLRKAFQQSPTTSLNTSKGSLYPLIARMIDRGFVSARPGRNAQGSDELSLTKRGRKALASWVTKTDADFSFGNDPLLIRLASLADVSREDRIQWIAETKRVLLEKKEELERFRADSGDDEYAEILHGTASAMLDLKLQWLDRLLIRVVRDDA